jgi:protein-S-isoprenylcysteine O-methyltransferase Ste14
MRKGVVAMIQIDAFQDGDERVMSPPLVPVAVIVIAIACLLQWLQPIQIIADIAFIEDIDPDTLSLVGLVVAVAGLSLSVSGFHALKSRGGVVNPRPLPKTLVTDGVFRWTRNPGYLGMLIALFGLALIFAFDWLLILIAPTWGILNFAVVRHEEYYLQQRFGRAYRDYKKRAPRYFFVH